MGLPRRPSLRGLTPPPPPTPALRACRVAVISLGRLCRVASMRVSCHCHSWSPPTQKQDLLCPSEEAQEPGFVLVPHALL